MLVADFVKKAEIISKIEEVFKSSKILELKDEMSNYHGKHLTFIKENFSGDLDEKDFSHLSFDEIKELNPINNSFFKKFYKPIVKANTSLDALVKDINLEDLKLLGIDQFINSSKKIEEVIFSIEDDENFPSEIIIEILKLIDDYTQTFNNILFSKKIYGLIKPISLKTNDKFVETEIIIHVKDFDFKRFSQRVQALESLYETITILNGMSDTQDNRLLILRAEKDSGEYYKLAGLAKLINDFKFLISGWSKYHGGTSSEKSVEMQNIQTRIKELIKANNIPIEEGSKHIESIKNALNDLDVEKFIDINIDNENIVFSEENNKKSDLKEKKEIQSEQANKNTKVIEKTKALPKPEKESSEEDFLRKGIELMSIKRYKEAISYFDAAIGVNSKYAEAFNYKGAAYIQLGDFKDALTCIESAIQIKPDYKDAYLNKGTALFSMAKFADALEEYSKTIKIDNNYAEGYFNIGSCYMMLPDSKKEAINSFTSAIMISPYYSAAYYNRACAYISIKEQDSCLKDLETAVQIDKSFKQMLKFDNDFAPLKENKRFKEIIA